MNAREFDARARSLGFVPTPGGWRHPAAPGRIVHPLRNPLDGRVLRRMTIWRLRRVAAEIASAQRTAEIARRRTASVEEVRRG